jgi:hypothetical protein
MKIIKNIFKNFFSKGTTSTLKKVQKKIIKKKNIHIVSVNGCMADDVKIIDRGIILKKISKIVYGSPDPIEIYVCEFPSGTRELAVSRCYVPEDSNVLSYWT